MTIKTKQANHMIDKLYFEILSLMGIRKHSFFFLNIHSILMTSK